MSDNAQSWRNLQRRKSIMKTIHLLKKAGMHWSNLWFFSPYTVFLMLCLGFITCCQSFTEKGLNLIIQLSYNTAFPPHLTYPTHSFHLRPFLMPWCLWIHEKPRRVCCVVLAMQCISYTELKKKRKWNRAKSEAEFTVQFLVTFLDHGIQNN